MRILFLHGWHSQVGGVKPTYLKNQGNEVFNPALDDDDFERAVQQAQAEFDRYRPEVIVGSSRGGAVAMNLASEHTPMVLLCPAWKRWGHVKKLQPHSVILHSRLDDVIPFSDSEELITVSELPIDTLIEVGSDHRLADEVSLQVMHWACVQLTSRDGLLRSEANELSQAHSRQRRDSAQEGTYVCDACGEEIVIPVDLSEGARQQYIEDCPVCCNANVIHVSVSENGEPLVWAEPEQDYD